MIKHTLGDQLIGHISRDSTAIEARECIAKEDKVQVAPVKPKNKRARPAKGEVRPAPEPSALERQSSQTLAQIIAQLDTACTTGTKKNSQGYKTRSGAERCNSRLKDEFGARHVQVRGHTKVMCHLMLGVVALCADQFTRLLV